MFYMERTELTDFHTSLYKQARILNRKTVKN